MAAIVALVAATPASCAHAPSCDGVSCAAACPRDALVDATGRCACAEGDVLMLGACVPPPVAAAFCGPAASVGAAGGGCAFRLCSADESLDAVSGTCVARASLPHGGAIACEEPTVPIVEEGRLACVPRDATCPRGAGLRSGTCVRPPSCPPGTLSEGSSCRAIVTSGASGARSGTLVDVGAWATLVVGVDGGLGSAWLCRPLAQRPSAFAGELRDRREPRLAGGKPDASDEPGDANVTDASDAHASASPVDGARSPAVRISVSATFPDQDVSRLHIEIGARSATGRSLEPPAEAAVSSAVGTLFELLRGLGGEATAAAVGLEVTCMLTPSP